MQEVIVLLGVLAAAVGLGLLGRRWECGCRPEARLQNSLMAALESYRANFGAYPPSRDESIGTGAQCLYYYLMGPNEKGWGSEPENGGIPARYAWGPARELDAEWMVGGGPGTETGRKFFCDGGVGGAKAVLYYRADVGRARPARFDEVYDRRDNNGPADSPFWSPSAEQWEALVRNPRSAEAAPYRPESYLLIGAGTDRVFGPVDGVSDDILGPSLARAN